MRRIITRVGSQGTSCWIIRNVPQSCYTIIIVEEQEGELWLLAMMPTDKIDGYDFCRKLRNSILQRQDVLIESLKS